MENSDTPNVIHYHSPDAGDNLSHTNGDSTPASLDGKPRGFTVGHAVGDPLPPSLDGKPRGFTVGHADGDPLPPSLDGKPRGFTVGHADGDPLPRRLTGSPAASPSATRSVIRSPRRLTGGPAASPSAAPRARPRPRQPSIRARVALHATERTLGRVIPNRLRPRGPRRRHRGRQQTSAGTVTPGATNLAEQVVPGDLLACRRQSRAQPPTPNAWFARKQA